MAVKLQPGAFIVSEFEYESCHIRNVQVRQSASTPIAHFPIKSTGLRAIKPTPHDSLTLGLEAGFGFPQPSGFIDHRTIAAGGFRSVARDAPQTQVGQVRLAQQIAWQVMIGLERSDGSAVIACAALGFHRRVDIVLAEGPALLGLRRLSGLGSDPAHADMRAG